MKNMFVFFVTLTPKKISYIWQSCFIYAHVTVLHTTLLESLSEGKCAIHCLHYATFVATACCTNVLDFTSSNFSAIMENALKMPSVGPVMVTILSGDDPSDMLMRAPLWKQKSIIIPTLHYARNPCPDTWFEFLARETLKILLTSSLIFFTVSPFWVHAEINGMKEEVWLVTIKRN